MGLVDLTVVDEHIAVFTLNRPDAYNAVSSELSEEFERHLETFEADDALWLGIITSSQNKVFCAGADLKSISAGKSVTTAKGGFAGLVQFPREKVLIACVEGMALAGGCEIVLACDLVVASEKAKFGVPEVKRSLVAAAGGLFRLPRKLPLNIAMELNLTGEPMSAQRMASFGFVNRLCPPGTCMEEALKLAKTINQNAPLAVREARNAVINMNAIDFLSEEDCWGESMGAMANLFVTPDFKEGPRAFAEKRAPKWTGKRSKM